jgi:hypothetical protein
MTGFEDREKGFEAKYKLDQEQMFRIQNRRNRLLGMWAAELMGLPATEAEAYARTVVTADFDRPGDMDVHDKVFADLKGKGVDLSDHRLRRKMDELLETARAQIMNEGGL